MPAKKIHPVASRQSSGLRVMSALIVLSMCVHCAGQTDTTPVPSAEPNATVSSPPGTNAPSWIVRDPVTGRLFRQSLASVSVPVTRWEAKSVEQTVYEPQVNSAVQQVPQTLFVPRTQVVMQPKLRGWWNPLKPPVTAYEYNPVTHWVPTNQTISQAVPTQQWVPKQQKIVVYQPVQTTEIRQQLVQVELPQPTNTSPSSLLPGVQPRSFAANINQPQLRLPNFATSQQARLARSQWPYNQQVQAHQLATNQGSLASRPTTSSQQPVSQHPVYTNPASYPSIRQQAVLPPSYPVNPASAAPSSTYGSAPFSTTNSGLRPVVPMFASLPSIPLPRFATRPYNAPLHPVTSGLTTESRDSIQAGMQATDLR